MARPEDFQPEGDREESSNSVIVISDDDQESLHEVRNQEEVFDLTIGESEPEVSSMSLENLLSSNEDEVDLRSPRDMSLENLLSISEDEDDLRPPRDISLESLLSISEDEVDLRPPSEVRGEDDKRSVVDLDSNEDERSSSFRDEENSSCKEGSNSLREYDDLRSLIPFKKKTEQPEIFFLFNQVQVASHSRVNDRRRVVLKERKRSDKEKPEEKKGLKRRKRRNRRRKKKPWSAAAAIARHKNSKQVTKN